MKVLIAKQNESIIKELFKKAIFKESTKTTSTFEISTTRLKTLVIEVKILGYNPYALMYW